MTNDVIKQQKPRAHPFRLFAAALHTSTQPLISAISLTVLSPQLIQFGTPKWAVPLIRAGATFLGLLNPVVGEWSDRCPSRFGRRKPFIFVGMILALVAVASFAIVVTGPFNKKAENIFLLVVSFIILLLSGNFQTVPGKTLVFDLAADDQKLFGNLIVLVLYGLGSLTGVLLIASHFYSYAFIGGIVIILNLMTFIFAPDPKHKSSSAHKKTSGGAHIFQGLKYVLKNRQLFVIFLLTFLSCLAFLYYGSSMTLFVTSAIFHTDDEGMDEELRKKNYKKGVTLGSIAYSVIVVSMLLFSAVASPLIKKVGIKKVFFVVEGLSTACFFVMFFMSNLQPSDIWIIFVTNFVLGITSALLLTIPPVMLAELVAGDELGMYLGLLSLVQLMGQSFSSLLPAGINAPMDLYVAGKHYLQWDFLADAIIGCSCCVTVLFLQSMPRGGKGKSFHFSKLSDENKEEMVSMQLQCMTATTSECMAAAMSDPMNLLRWKESESPKTSMDETNSLQNISLSVNVEEQSETTPLLSSSD